MTTPRRRRTPTATRAFGTGRREAHDASGFYDRFEAPSISADDDVKPAPDLHGEELIHGDARDMAQLPDRCVALVVTSPPYFAGKAYEADLTANDVPGTYAEYLDLLRDVFAECTRVLEPGGRIAVNVANLGRKPYRSLAADVIRILQDDHGLLLRGEIVWQKADGAGGNCAWGSFGSPVNPVLRDLTERVIVASKGRFDRAVPPRHRQARGLPHRPTITNDDFMQSTLDLWHLPTESARRVGHPAPFPVELPARLIDLYTFEGDLVLDPFLGAGTTAVAAKQRGRRWIGYDLDPDYLAIARARVADAVVDDDGATSVPSRAATRGKAAQALAEEVLADAGFRIAKVKHRIPRLGITVDVVAVDADDQPWWFDVTGAFTTPRGGLIRTDTLWRCLGRAGVIAARGDDQPPLVLLTSYLPPARSVGDHALRALVPALGQSQPRWPVHDAVEMLDAAGQGRLAAYAAGGRVHERLPGFWTDAELHGGT